MGDAVAFGHPIAAGLILILSVFGFVHLRRTAPEKEILPRVCPCPSQRLMT